MMNLLKYLFLFALITGWITVNAQNETIRPRMEKSDDNTIWTLYNRAWTNDDGVYLDARQNDGLLYLKDLKFKNGTIELDIKGKDLRGRSFVGLAFHGVNDSTCDIIYFRPFNFQSPERKGHSVQYVSHPEYSWYKLREEHPEEYENQLTPVPEPDDWFHAKIVVNHPSVKVYVNDSEQSSLEIEQLSNQKEGWIGLWVGNGSDGWFRNLSITITR